MPFQNSFNNVITTGLKVFLGGDAVGDIYYRDASGNFVRLPLGTPGQALIAGASIPVYGNPIPGGNAGGDFTGTYPNPTIAANAVTFPKIQNINSGLILGRSAAGAGNIEALSAAQIRTILALGTAALVSTGNGVGNVPLIEAGGTLNPAIMPPITLTSIQIVANAAARLALTNVQPGDSAKQTDNGITYLLAATPASTDANWVPIGDTTIDAGDIVSGIISPVRLGSGTPSSANYLRGDGTWQPTPASGAMPWIEVTGTASAMTAGSGYITNNTSLVTLTLPTAAAQGSLLRVVGLGTGGWRIAQNTGQQIHYLGQSTTVGETGRIDAELTQTSSSKACMTMVCVVPNTTWVVNASVGTVNIV